MKRICGITLLGFSFLYIGRTVSYAQISMYLNKLSQISYSLNTYEYITPFEILCAMIAFMLSLYLIFSA